MTGASESEKCLGSEWTVILASDSVKIGGDTVVSGSNSGVALKYLAPYLPYKVDSDFTVEDC